MTWGLKFLTFKKKPAVPVTEDSTVKTETEQKDKDIPVNEDKTNEKDSEAHVHEFTGRFDHGHRFSGVSTQAIPLSEKSHCHGIFTSTDAFHNHRHEIVALTGPEIIVSVTAGKHVHFVEPVTTINEGHYHHLSFATQVDSAPE